MSIYNVGLVIIEIIKVQSRKRLNFTSERCDETTLSEV